MKRIVNQDAVETTSLKGHEMSRGTSPLRIFDIGVIPSAALCLPICRFYFMLFIPCSVKMKAAAFRFPQLLKCPKPCRSSGV